MYATRSQNKGSPSQKVSIEKLARNKDIRSLTSHNNSSPNKRFVHKRLNLFKRKSLESPNI